MYLSKTIQVELNTTISAISNGTLLWEIQTMDIVLYLALSPDESTLYYSSFVFPNLSNFAVYALNASSGLLLYVLSNGSHF